MVASLHAEITAEPDSKDPTKFSRYSVVDRSLNGTYVNDQRAPTVSGELYLKKGDVIKFGHVNGASYKPGEYAIGNEPEFIFTFEPAYEGMKYIDHTPDGNRKERKGPQAYIHLGAHSLLPHEFDLFSLVPKRESDLSVIPLPAVSNKAIIPNMTNYNLLTNLGKISEELQQLQITEPEKSRIDEALFEFMCSSGLTEDQLSSNPCFHKLLHELCPSYKLPTNFTYVV
uniref:FHA domain-containing protein n=1 Tax=Panagrolaimus davidi TaxID=227884 RepID=A0A914QIU6_9BILA